MCLLLLPASSNAEERANSLNDGAWALQFSFESGFNGGRVAAKYHLSDKNALRAGFSFFGRTEDTEANETDGDAFDFSRDNARMDTELTYARYPRPQGSANFYFGGGPYVQYDERNERRFESFDGEAQERIFESETIEVGLVAMLGAEWFPSRAISLHVEYTARGGRFWEDGKESYTSTFQYEVRDIEGEGWDFDSGQLVMAGFSIYF